jgi:hypothetical protein
MKKANISTLLGFVFIIIGLVFSPTLFGIQLISTLMLAIVSAIASGIFFFVVYLKRGLRNWGYLIPACLSVGIAASAALATLGARGGLLSLPIVAAFGVPFLAAFLLEPKTNFRALLPATLAAAAVVGLAAFWIFNLSILTTSAVIALSITFLSWFLLNPKKIWTLLALAALILVYAMVRVFLPSYSDVLVSLSFTGFAVLVMSINYYAQRIGRSVLVKVFSPVQRAPAC